MDMYLLQATGSMTGHTSLYHHSAKEYGSNSSAELVVCSSLAIYLIWQNSSALPCSAMD